MTKHTKKRQKGSGNLFSRVADNSPSIGPGPSFGKRQVIGEGTYGCVHKPSLECVDPGHNYDGVVSKLMPMDAALSEQREFRIIDGLDPLREFHLGRPEVCVPKIDDQSVKDIGKCQGSVVNVFDVESNPNNFRLLLMKDGGQDLRNLVDVVFNFKIPNYFRDDARVQILFQEMRKLIIGVQIMRQNNIIHHDLKPQNILMNSETGKLSMIDFGLMTTKREFKYHSSTNNNQDLGIFHWNFPPECGFSNLDDFNAYVLQTANIDEIYKNLNVVFNPAIAITRDDVKPTMDVCRQYTRQFLASFDRFHANDYEKVLNLAADSIDVYGLGMSFVFLLLSVKKQNVVYSEKCRDLIALFREMCSVESDNRLTDIDEILRRYDDITR